MYLYTLILIQIDGVLSTGQGGKRAYLLFNVYQKNDKAVLQTFETGDVVPNGILEGVRHFI